MSSFLFRQKKSKYLLPLILIALLLPALVESILVSLGDISSYYQLYYFIGYDYGFGGRKLLGTFFCNLLPGHVGHRQLLPIIWGINLVFLFLFVWFVSEGLKKASVYGIGFGLFLLYALWFVSPFSISSYFSQGVNLMFPEIWSMTLVLAFLFLHKYGRGEWWYYLLTLLICVLCCLIHHVFCCLFFPLVFAIVIGDVLSENNTKKDSLKKAFLYVAICLILTAVFVAIWLFSHMNTDLNSVYEAICQRTAVGVCSHDRDAINQLYYLSNIENRINQASNFPIQAIGLLLTIIVMSPLIIILIAPWALAYKRSTTKKSRWKYLLVGLVPIVIHAPIFFFAVDYGRWEYAWFFNYICLLVFFVWNGDKGIIDAIKGMKEWGKKHLIFLACIFIYLAVLPESTAWNIPLIHQVAEIIIR